MDREPADDQAGDVGDRIGEARARLTRAERRVAEVVLERPEVVAFGTVAELAQAAGVGAATAVRLSAKLGFDGFTQLQLAVQRDLARQLRPAAERIRGPAARGTARGTAMSLAVELENLRATLAGVPDEVVTDAVRHLADLRRSVVVISGDASVGVASQVVGDLAALRPKVEIVVGSEVAVQRRIAHLRPGDVVVAIDVRRYDRWLVDAVGQARSAKAWILALTDSLLSPVAAAAHSTMIVSAAGAGPFDSHVGTLALGNVLVAGVADRLRTSAAVRLQRAEYAWRETGSLVDR